MQALMVTGAALLGLLVGSFINVVIWRVPRGESIVHPPSHCPSCGGGIAARDNIPVFSWIFLAGRCRACHARIPVRYPLVEVATVVLFAGMALRFGPHPPLPAYLYLAAVGLALAVIDLDLCRLPNALTLPSYVVGGALLGMAAGLQGEPLALVRAFVGMAAMYVFYLALVLAKPGGMGWGDVKLAGVLGLYLGFMGWDELAVGAFSAFLLGGLFSIALMVLRRADRKTKIPFGPYMVAGAFLAVFVGHALADWYVHLTLG